jgi:hypothetical protein
MGLKSGSDGVKAQFRTKFPKAFSKVNRLVDLVEGINQPREGVVNVIDGNVLMMAAPSAVQTYYEYVNYTRHALRQHAEAASLLLVVFDEPKHLTTAKLEEQIRRDEVGEKRAMVVSDDLAAPCNDEYTLDDLIKVINCRELIRHRPARLRFFDSIIMAVLEEEKLQGRVGAGSPLELAEIVVDGIDGRGAHRSEDEDRVAGVVGTDEELVTWYARDAEHQIGEGDLKLTWASIRSDELIAEGHLEATTCLLTTIDTDSLLVETIETAKRRCLPKQEGRTKRILCMRERAGKEGGPYYTVCDLETLHNQLVRHLWAMAPSLPTADTSLHAILLASGALASCGCDFCGIAGMTAERTLEVLPELLAENVRAQGNLLSPIVSMNESRSAAKRVARPLREVVASVEELTHEVKGLRSKTRESLTNPNPDHLKRAAWVISYWSGTTWSGSLTDFGFSL